MAHHLLDALLHTTHRATVRGGAQTHRFGKNARPLEDRVASCEADATPRPTAADLPGLIRPMFPPLPGTIENKLQP